MGTPGRCWLLSSTEQGTPSLTLNAAPPASTLRLGSAGEELIVLSFLTPVDFSNLTAVSTLCSHSLSTGEEGERRQ